MSRSIFQLPWRRTIGLWYWECLWYWEWGHTTDCGGLWAKLLSPMAGWRPAGPGSGSGAVQGSRKNSRSKVIVVTRAEELLRRSAGFGKDLSKIHLSLWSCGPQSPSWDSPSSSSVSATFLPFGSLIQIRFPSCFHIPPTCIHTTTPFPSP